MSCETVRSLIPGYIYAALTDEESAVVREHISVCPSCVEELERTRGAFSLLSQWAADEPPSDMTGKTLRRAEKHPWYLILFPRLRIAAGALLAIATVVSFLFGSFLEPDNQQTLLQAQNTYLAGTSGGMRIVLLTADGGKPIGGGRVTVELQSLDTRLKRLVFEGATDRTGSVAAMLPLTDVAEGSYQLRVRARSREGADSITRTVTVKRAFKILLSTDKPVYQPGQVIHMRALTLDAGSNKASESAEVTFEAEDPKGNKVFKKRAPIGDFGVASADFTLASEIAAGDYHLRVTAGGDTTDRIVSVRSYALPKFKVAFEPGKRAYLPAETVTGLVSAGYFFGKSIEGARVVIDVSTFDAAFHRIARIEGRTGAKGRYSFELPLPSSFTGHPLAGGRALLKFDVSVIDRAGHEEKVADTLTVAESLPEQAGAGKKSGAVPITIDCIPERSPLVSGLENRIFLVTTLPGGAPAPCEVTVSAPGTYARCRSDEMGIAEVALTPSSTQTEITVEAKSGAARFGRARFVLAGDAQQDGVLVRTDRSLYKVGETVRITVLSPDSRGYVYVDLVREGQTAVTRSVHLIEGRGETSIDLSEDMAGTLRIAAYRLTESGETVRDVRTIIVTQAASLDVTARPDKRAYRPGESAHIVLSVRDGRGNPVRAALGVSIVDESVFALAQQHPGLEKIYFALEKELMEPTLEVCAHNNALNMGSIALENRVASTTQRAAAVILAAFHSQEAGTFVNSLTDKVARLMTLRERFRSAALFLLLILMAGLLLWASFRGPKESVDAESAFPQDSQWLRILPMLLASVLAVVCRLWVMNGNLSQPENLLFIAVLSVVTSLCLIPIIGAVRAIGARKGPGGIMIYLFSIAVLAQIWGAAANVFAAWYNLAQALFTISFTVIAIAGFVSLVTTAAWGTVTHFSNRIVALSLVTALAVGAIFSLATFTSSPLAALLTFAACLIVLNVVPARSNPLGGAVRTMNALTLLCLFLFILILPNFIRARAQGPATACRSNLKNIGTALEMYSTDHRGRYPMSLAQLRVRQFFPETLYWNPLVLTDGDGKASLDIPIADSITAWRLSALASSRAGVIGSVTSPLLVFQDFFVDPDIPAHFTRGDRVAVPVAIYNYLPGRQEVKITLVPDDWFRTRGALEKTIVIEPDDVASVTFPLEVMRVGTHRFTVLAFSKSRRDAVSREVRVEPDGKETAVSQSGALEKHAVVKISIPGGSVPGGSRILAKLFTGTATHLVDGLEGLLRMPYGCFEQTSSVTYPNILILRYLNEAGKASPELRLEAEGLINTGYQRLLSFEVPGGGFDWFGRPPANRILTAYGLMEFHDMNGVYPIDENVIARTQAWLTGQQRSDGSFAPESHGMHDGLQSGGDALLSTAYITWALLESGSRGSATEKALDFLRRNLAAIKDPYTAALAAHAFGLGAPGGGEMAALLERLVSCAVTDEKSARWQCERTATFGSGEAGSVEATSLAALALLRYGRGEYGGIVRKAINHLILSRGAEGSWGSTAATVLALKTLCEAQGKSVESRGKVRVLINGSVHTTFVVTPENSDVLQVADLSDAARQGENTIELVQDEGGGSFTFQVTGKYFTPWQDVDNSERRGLSIRVSYDRTLLTTDDVLNVKAVVANDGENASPMVIADIGVPPGFTVMSGDFEALRSQGKISRYEMRGRQVIVYLRGVGAGGEIALPYRLKARHPLKARTPASSAYEYYNPARSASDSPQIIEVR